MTDRFNALVVVLDIDTREDDAEEIINAIRMFKRVISVEGNVVNIDSMVAEQRAQREMRDKILKLII